MNKRMRKLLVSLGMVVVLGSGNIFADTTPNIDISTPAGLKEALDVVDDFGIFANSVNLIADTETNIAANEAKLNHNFGYDHTYNGASAGEIAIIKKSSKRSYINKITEMKDEPIRPNNILLIDESQHTLGETDGGSSWTLEFSGIGIKKLSPKDKIELYHTNNQINISSELDKLKTVSEKLAKQGNTSEYKIVNNVTLTELTNSRTIRIDTLDSADSAIDGTTPKHDLVIVNIDTSKITVGTDGKRILDITSGITINSDTLEDWDELAGKVMFNFVDVEKDESGNITKVTPFNGTITTDKLFQGTILAPAAKYQLKGGNLNGAVFCNEFLGNRSEVHEIDFEIVEKGLSDVDLPNGTIEGPESGDALLIAPLGVAAVGAAVVFFANRKDDDDE